MRIKRTVSAMALLGFFFLAAAQQSDIITKITGGTRPIIAIPDLRASGAAEPLMNTFNATLWADVADSGLFSMGPKSMYPLEVPQQPQDFKPPVVPKLGARKNAPPPQPIRQGPWLTDWSAPPVNAKYLSFGYGGIQDGKLVLFGYLYDVQQPEPASAQVIGKLYFGSLDEAGARKVAHDFSTDILKLFGGQTLQGSSICFASSRTGKGIKELWSMDFDGANQKQLTFYKTVSTMPAVSPDGKRLAFTSFHLGNPAILIHSLETGRRLPFYNQAASMNATAEFTPDGKSILFSNTLSGYAQIYVANVDGSGVRRISSSRAIEVEPKVNPKSPSELVFVSGRSGHPQIYKMNMDGADVIRLTPGEGEAVNPSWHPDGRHIAFAWTKGYDPGNYNIFVMDVATQEYVQLTHGTGRNENPVWGPDGKHLVFSSNRSGTNQLYTMLADGTQLKQLTTQGINEKPAWSRQ